jgi:hypothetical protein
MTRYRLYYKAVAGHVTYRDYSRLSAARLALNHCDWPGWEPMYITLVTLQSKECRNVMKEVQS